MKATIGILAAALLTQSAFAQVFKVLVAFDKGPVGAVPAGGLVYSGGYLYGTIREGGNYNNGSVFRASTNGTPFLEILHFNGTNGRYPNGGMVMSGNILYGTASSGGTSNNGVVFKLWDFGQSFSSGVLKSFATNEGRAVNGGLALSGSTLYGTTFGYLIPLAPPGGDTVFKLQNDGTGFLVLSNLTGMNPPGGLVVNGSSLYGTTRNGGSGSLGSLYRISTSGTGYSTVVSFAGTNGSRPNGNLVLSGDTLYGMTTSGGAFGNGTIFGVKTNGSNFVTLKSFSALVSQTNSDGAMPASGLVLSGDSLYGATSEGGTGRNGVLFKINTNGSGFAVLKHFPATQFTSGVYTNGDGARPNGDLVMQAGTLYGTTSSGGRGGRGVLFSLLVPPEIQIGDGLPGVRSNRFAFFITGAPNQPVAVEARTNLASGNWALIQNLTLGAGPYYFSHLQWTNSSERYYRVRAR